MICREREHLVDTGKVRFVGLSEIIMGGICSAGKVAGEGENPVIGAAVIGTVRIIGAGTSTSIHRALNPCAWRSSK